eukprot:CAMPEP_0198227000 /NCGR_PEP_ID=MMETSP1445-20131203/107474_1 /TAXON_ID=36898 /ORGANISM="Pyramimonas sp., Strain CCMP2087" /LENGTH=85 /DNA_ID=CAMNT_0043906943 /DNA_START=452 /DNA_END=709 /DNA_ORIENTATION=+
MPSAQLRVFELEAALPGLRALQLILEEPRLVGNLRQLRTQPLVLRSDFCILCKFLSQHCFLFLVMRQCLVAELDILLTLGEGAVH